MVIRPLITDDIPDALALTRQAGWNQTGNDWQRLLTLSPNGCFAAIADSRLAGAVSTIAYGKRLAWVGMMLVDPGYRRRGIGKELMSTALNYLHHAGIGTVMLDATPDGRPLYDLFGFECRSVIERWERPPVSSHGQNIRRPIEPWRRQILALDREAFGADRSILLDSLSNDSYDGPFIAVDSDRIVQGYAFARIGSRAAYLGPVVARSTVAGLRILDDALRPIAGRDVYIDVNTDFGIGAEALEERGFRMQRSLTRMRYGKPFKAGGSNLLMAIAGPELG